MSVFFFFLSIVDVGAGKSQISSCHSDTEAKRIVRIGVNQFLHLQLQANAAVPTPHPKPPDMTMRICGEGTLHTLQLAELEIFCVCQCSTKTIINNALGRILALKEA